MPVNRNKLFCGILIYSFCLLVLIGCGSISGTFQAYEGYQKPTSEISVIKVDTRTRAIVRIYEVDDYNTTKPIDFVNFPSEIMVLPGKHYLKVQIGCCGVVTDFWAWGYVNVETSASKTYLVNGGEKNGKRLIWVTEKDSGEVIAETKLETFP